MSYFKSPLNFVLTSLSVLFLVAAALMVKTGISVAVIAVIMLAALQYIFNRRSTLLSDMADAKLQGEREKEAIKNAVKLSSTMQMGKGSPATLADIGPLGMGGNGKGHGAWVMWPVIFICYPALGVLISDKSYTYGAITDLSPIYPFLFAVLMMASAEVAGEIRSPKLKKLANILMAVLIAVGLVFFIYGLIALPR